MFSTTFFKWLFVYLLTFSHNSVILVLRANMTGEDSSQHLGGKHGKHCRVSVTCWRAFLSKTRKIKMLCNNMHPSLQFLNRDCQCAAKLHKIPLPLLRPAQPGSNTWWQNAKQRGHLYSYWCSSAPSKPKTKTKQFQSCLWTFFYDEEHKNRHK